MTVLKFFGVIFTAGVGAGLGSVLIGPVMIGCVIYAAVIGVRDFWPWMFGMAVYIGLLTFAISCIPSKAARPPILIIASLLPAAAIFMTRGVTWPTFWAAALAAVLCVGIGSSVCEGGESFREFAGVAGVQAMWLIPMSILAEQMADGTYDVPMLLATIICGLATFPASEEFI